MDESYSGEIEKYGKSFAGDLGSKSFDLGLGFLIVFFALFRIPPISQNCCQAQLLIVNEGFTKLENL